MGRFIQGRNIIPRKNKQLAYGLELQNLIKERQQKLKKKGMKSNGI